MKLVVSILLILLVACSKPPVNAPDSVLNALSKESLKEHLTYISSDEMKGRQTGSPELKKVANFLADKLKSYGYTGLGENGSFFQEFKMTKATYDFSTLSLTIGKKVKAKVGKDIAVFSRGSMDLNYNNDIIFVKEGIYNNDVKQFNAEDVKGKFAFVTPLSAEMKEKFPKMGSRKLRGYLVDSLGAIGVIQVVSKTDKRTIPGYAHYASGPAMRFEGTKLRSTTVFITEKVAKQVFKRERKRLNSKTKSFTFRSKIQLSLKANGEEIITQNVVAELKGIDEKLADEYVAYGSHYDHVGEKDGEIYNGADDDGSGTVAVLEMAKAISKEPTRRSTMIVFHTGEEKGLLGSQYYSKNQIVPMEKIVALFNMDMVGRSGKMVDGKMQDYSGKPIKDDDNTRITMPNEIYVIGADKISKELDAISTKMNDMFVKMDLNYDLNDEAHPARIYYRSDHWNYAKHGVPIIFYFDGIHEDYHKPTDTIEKIDFNKIYLTSKLALTTGYHVANKDQRVKID